MPLKLVLLGSIAVPAVLIYLLSMRTTPHRGILRVCEKFFVGVILVYGLNLALSLFDLRIAQNPLSSLTAGFLGFPGAVLAFVVQNLL